MQLNLVQPVPSNTQFYGICQGSTHYIWVCPTTLRIESIGAVSVSEAKEIPPR